MLIFSWNNKTGLQSVSRPVVLAWFIILWEGAGCLATPLVQKDKQTDRTGGTSRTHRSQIFDHFLETLGGI